MPGQTTDIGQRISMVPFHLGSFLGGLSDYEDKGIAGSFKSGYGLDIRKQKDTLSCQNALKDDLAVGSMTAPCYFVVPASDGQTYFFCNDGKIFRRKANGSYLVQGYGIVPVYTDTFESGQIIGACEWYSGYDSITAPNGGYTYLIWATPTRLNIKKIAGPQSNPGAPYVQTEPWNDVNNPGIGSWPKTNLTSVAWHTMVNANGTLQICNGNVMALVGYDLSYTNNSLKLIPGNLAQNVLERGKYSVIGCRSAAGKDETSFFNWDGIGLSWNNKKVISFGGINSMLDTEMALAQIGNNGQLYISDFNSPVPFRQIRGGGASYPDGIAPYHGMALVGIYGNTNLMNGVYANGIYSVGRVNKNAPLVLNLEYQLTCDAIYSIEVVGTDILCTYSLNSQYGVKIVDTGTKATAVYQSLDLVVPMGTRRYPMPLGRILNWQKVDIECQPLPPGTAIEVWYKIDKAIAGGANNDGWFQANTQDGSVQFLTKNMQNAVFYIGVRGRVCEVQFILIPSGDRTPEICEANVYFTA